MIIVIAGSDVDTKPDKGFSLGQVVRVFPQSEQRIYCFKVTPHTAGLALPRVDIGLWKKEQLRAVPIDRYDIRNGCLWMNSLQQADSGQYSLYIDSCFTTPHRPKNAIDFSMSVIQGTGKYMTADQQDVHRDHPYVNMQLHHRSATLLQE